MRLVRNCQATKADLRVEWASVTEAVENVTTAAPAAINVSHMARHWGCWGNSWADMRSESWMREALQTPDPTTLESVKSLSEKIEARIPSMTRSAPKRVRRRNLEDGCEITPDRFLMRSPEMWERMERTAQPTRTIKIAVEYSVSCMQTRSDMLYRGAALIALSDWLCVNGYSVEIVGLWCDRAITSGGGLSWSAVTIKPFRSPLDIGAITTATCEIAFARMIVLLGQAVHSDRVLAGNLGYPAPMPEAVKQELSIDLTCPTSVTTESRAVEWLAETVTKLSEAR